MRVASSSPCSLLLSPSSILFADAGDGGNESVHFRGWQRGGGGERGFAAGQAGLDGARAEVAESLPEARRPGQEVGPGRVGPSLK